MRIVLCQGGEISQINFTVLCRGEVNVLIVAYPMLGMVIVFVFFTKHMFCVFVLVANELLLQLLSWVGGGGDYNGWVAH